MCMHARDPFVYARTCGEMRVLCVLNFIVKFKCPIQINCYKAFGSRIFDNGIKWKNIEVEI